MYLTKWAFLMRNIQMSNKQKTGHTFRDAVRFLFVC